jgi:hypothetical protein
MSIKTLEIPHHRSFSLGRVVSIYLPVASGRSLWAAPDFPDTLNGNMCSGERNGFKEALHGRIQA